MKSIWGAVRLSLSAIAAGLGYFVGGLDGLVRALLYFMAADYATGVLAAVSCRSVSSAIGFRGICKKVLILLLVGLAHILDTHVLGSGDAIRSAVACFYISNEGISLIENAARMGLPIPEKLKTMLAQLQAEGEQKGGE